MNLGRQYSIFYHPSSLLYNRIEKSQEKTQDKRVMAVNFL